HLFLDFFLAHVEGERGAGHRAEPRIDEEQTIFSLLHTKRIVPAISLYFTPSLRLFIDIY
ncbi:MAG: hypothetical protein KKD12_08370, partial [Proteobacteria bacterium]|nr:hypothetical protein [Pseudomonadota bacterium]